MVASALSSLLFDCEMPLPVDEAEPRTSKKAIFDVNLISQRLEVLSRASCPFARELRSYVERLLREYNSTSPRLDVLASHLALRGLRVAIRTALPGHGADCFKSLRHEFLIVQGTGDFSGMEFLVEPFLRQHFTIPHPSREYVAALASTPEVFVGGSCRLVPIVQLLCGLMADSFERQGLALPPWRREAAMLSKWLPQPNRFRDTRLKRFPSAPAQLPAAPEPSNDALDEPGPCSRPVRQTLYGYVPPSCAADMARPSDFLRVFRSHSESSHDSSVSGDTLSVHHHQGALSPISVLPMLPKPPPPSVPQRLLGFTTAPPTPAAAAAALNAAVGPQTVVGPLIVEGRNVTSGEGQQGASLAGLQEVAVAVQSRQDDPDQEASPFLHLRDGSTVLGPDTESSRSSSCSNSGSGGSKAGLLTAQLQNHFRSVAAATSAAAAGAGAADDGGKEAPNCGPASAVATPLIATRPPVHRGEMAIRVVKLSQQVGFHVTHGSVAASQDPVPTAKGQQPPLPHQHQEKYRPQQSHQQQLQQQQKQLQMEHLQLLKQKIQMHHQIQIQAGCRTAQRRPLATQAATEGPGHKGGKGAVAAMEATACAGAGAGAGAGGFQKAYMRPEPLPWRPVRLGF